MRGSNRPSHNAVDMTLRPWAEVLALYNAANPDDAIPTLGAVRNIGVRATKKLKQRLTTQEHNNEDTDCPDRTDES